MSEYLIKTIFQEKEELLSIIGDLGRCLQYKNDKDQEDYFNNKMQEIYRRLCTTYESLKKLSTKLLWEPIVNE